MHSTPQSNRFTKKNRLQDAAAFQRVFRYGHRGVSGDFKWFAAANEIEIARLGASVPKRHVKTAVCRNLLKRQIRESFRTHQKTLQGLDVVIVVRQHRAAPDPSTPKDLERIWDKVTKRFCHDT